MWLRLAFHEPYLPLPVPASGAKPDGVLRDDAPALRPSHLFRADPGAFQHALVRLSTVRSPWLREIPGNLTQHMRAGLFPARARSHVGRATACGGRAADANPGTGWQTRRPGRGRRAGR